MELNSAYSVRLAMSTVHSVMSCSVAPGTAMMTASTLCITCTASTLIPPETSFPVRGSMPIWPAAWMIRSPESRVMSMPCE